MSKSDLAFSCAQVPSSRRTPEGVCRDFTPSYETEDRDAYVKWVKRCEQLWAEDPKKARRAGCKRTAHLPIRRGRLSFKDEGRSPKDRKLYDPTAATERRWADYLPPLDARTQSEATRTPQRPPKEAQVRALAAQIREGLFRYADSTTSDEVWTAVHIPRDPAALTRFGVPDLAAAYLSKVLGGRSVPRQPEEAPSLPEAVIGAFGGAGLAPTGFFLLSRAFKLSRLRGPVRGLRPFLKQAAARLRDSVRGVLLVTGSVVELVDGEADVSPLSSWGPTFPQQLAGLQQDVQAGHVGADWGLVLQVQVPGGETAEVQLPGSFLLRGARGRRDYKTLHGFSLSELPLVVARHLLAPRRTRRGRHRERHPSAKPNPHRSLDMARSSNPWSFYSDGDFLAAIANPKRRKPKKYAGTRTSPTPKARKNPTLSRVSRRASQLRSHGYDPSEAMTRAWAEERSPKRKNPARKSKTATRKTTRKAARKNPAGRVMKRAHKIARANGCSMKTAMKRSWKIEKK